MNPFLMFLCLSVVGLMRVAFSRSGNGPKQKTPPTVITERTPFGRYDK